MAPRRAVCTVTAGLETVFHPNPAVGFLAQAGSRLSTAVGVGVLAPAHSLSE